MNYVPSDQYKDFVKGMGNINDDILQIYHLKYGIMIMVIEHGDIIKIYQQFLKDILILMILIMS